MSVAPPPVVGFRAHLRGASLWDLVQMECQARSRGVFQVTGEGGVGYLYIAGGRVVHAVARRLEGQAAALEILGWTNGSFQPCDRIWPPTPSIETPYEQLMLQVATRQDEERSSSSNLVAFPGRAPAEPTAVTPPPEPAEFELLEIAEEAHTDMRNPTNDQGASTPLGGRHDATAPFPVVIRLGSSGTVTNKGGSDELAEAVAYVHRLAQLAGEILGLDAFTAMECTFTAGRCLVFNDTNGDVVGVRPNPDANLAALREKLGL
jgi:hypothetical protein